VRFADNGKVSLDHIYTEPDPRAYFGTLREFDYCIPQLAKPYFAELIREYRAVQRIHVPHIVDIGCSYGVNAALLKFDLTMDELYERYCDPAAGSHSLSRLLARDRELARSRNDLRHTRFVGLDKSRPALSYALLAGFLDATVHADLEEREPSQYHRAQLARADLVISTGCVGYVTERTVSRVANAHGTRRPWMAHFVLRMFPFAPVADSLARLGYETVQLDQAFRQRRFVSREEQSLVMDTLSRVGVNPSGLEADGWLYAQLYVSRPRVTKERVVVDLAIRTDRG